MPTLKRPSARPPITTSPEKVEGMVRASAERGRLEREFTILGELGQGGMGTVYCVRDQRLCRSVALKVLSANLRLDRTATRRFAIEAQVAAQLEHPNILPLYALACDDSGQPGIVMRLVEGESFREYIDACGATAEAGLAEPRDLASRLERFLKVCDAIEYAHARGVVHRDLKPENIMLGPHNEVYVMDWGLAMILAPDEAIAEELTGLTLDGHTVGTPMYMAPEQARADRGSVGAASDQFALALLLQEVTTLNSPRKPDARQGLIRAAARNERAPLVHKYGRPLPRTVGAIIAKATATRPDRRYASVAEFAREVRRFARGDEVQALPDAFAGRVWRHLRRRPGLILGTLLGLALAATAVVIIAMGRELGARARADKQSRRLAALTARVAGAGGAIDARVALVDRLLEGLATSAVAALDRPPALPATLRSPGELLKDDRATTFLPRYHQRVTFEHATMFLPAAASRPPDALVAHGGDFERLLARTAVRAAGDDEALSLVPAEQRAVARDRSLLLWMALAFDDGLMFLYPGNTFFPPDYDARKRVWYTLVGHTRGRKWGSPYPDATSGALLVPCSVGLYDATDRFVGVAAVQIALDDLLSHLALDDAEGFREAAVLDKHGDVVFSTGQQGALMGVGVHENRALDPRPFQIGDVRAAVTSGSPDGRVRSGDAIVAFQRLGNFDWWLAVTVAAAPYDRQ